ncbi:MAG: hypothetical protein KJP22_06515 [Acidimicrobiia bacterium]|nr:hypothetical protein [Acidimicrobiia bacterium]NNF87619.1 hypothetical protein [Acidimicrobiia bacterium]NNJ47414.1 hypothetical protein [Acidimicrobiia bacterium]NNL70261.1 hypothetical protein [Acidimicrobiia bacterium]RZV40137.1 MAG: hypothetical protein EX267_12570 [Acidimicrobiia bacterium]
MFDFAAAPVAVRSDIQRGFRREWDRLSMAGTWWTGRERVDIARAARRARFGGEDSPSSLPTAAIEAAGIVSARPASIRRSTVETMADAIGYPRYVEIVGVTSRMAAVDSFHVGIGAPLETLPDPEPGEPSRAEEPLARPGAGWVPMVGGASITQALSIVDAESVAQEDMHGPLYLTYEGMAEFDYVGGLSRAQMELVAARTSAINECFY